MIECKYTKEELLYLEHTNRIIKEWREIMGIDPIWEISIEIIDEEGIIGGINIKNTQYYKAPILLTEDILELEEGDFILKINEMIPHELTHLLSADFFRTALLVAGDNQNMKDELRYKYEQFVVRITKILTKLSEQLLNLRIGYESDSKTNSGNEK